MYTPTPETLLRIENNFRYHAPLPGQTERYEKIRARGRDLAVAMVRCCPPSRELSLALTDLESAVMFANAAIARNETADDSTANPVSKSFLTDVLLAFESSRVTEPPVITPGPYLIQ